MLYPDIVRKRIIRLLLDTPKVGTGKSTLVQFIIKELGLKEEDVAYCAYTGRAAQVLRNKNCPEAMTTHRLLFNSKENADGTYKHFPKKLLEKDYKLIVCDEISMLPKSFFELMLTHNVHVIGLGDPAQLPPVSDDENEIHHLLDEPHIFLTEIMRQAEDNEIIRLSMDIRNGKRLQYHKGKDVWVIPKKELNDHIILTADTILCGTNNTRQIINEQYRRKTFGEDVPPYPINGEKIVCLKNNYDYGNGLGDALINGQIGTINGIKTKNTKLYKPAMYANFSPTEGGTFTDVFMDYNLFVNGEPTINKENYKKYKKEEKPCLFDYGYALTVWRAQGSEFDKVVVMVENYPYEKDMRQRFLYTAATRAAKKLVMVI